MDVLIVTLASALAGFVDSIVGGGGLILVPALFATFPSAPPAAMLGTNKSASPSSAPVWAHGRSPRSRQPCCVEPFPSFCSRYWPTHWHARISGVSTRHAGLVEKRCG